MSTPDRAEMDRLWDQALDDYARELAGRLQGMVENFDLILWDLEVTA